MTADPVNLRRDYGQRPLAESDLLDDPFALLDRWLHEAAEVDQLVEPTAMALATVDADGLPALRTVLLRRVHEGRLLFFTSYGSRKAAHLDAHPQAALLFRFADPQRQIEVRGTVARATAEESDAYFATRPRGSQIGAHASPQSRPIADRSVLEARVAEAEARFPAGEPIPRPQGWGGYAVTPTSWEFWQGRSSRLHDRFAYTPDGAGGWTRQRLGP